MAPAESGGTGRVSVTARWRYAGHTFEHRGWLFGVYVFRNGGWRHTYDDGRRLFYYYIDFVWCGRSVEVFIGF